MAETLLIFAPEGGSTERTAKKIQEKAGVDKIDILPASKISDNIFDSYNKFIFGIATVGADAWDSRNQDSSIYRLIKEIANSDWNNKTVALYGLGNSVTYRYHFVDDMGILAEMLEEGNADITGTVASGNYDFAESKALRGDSFIGLPIDEDTEPGKTDARIDAWLTSLKEKFNF